jgi:hypothetical protein
MPNSDRGGDPFHASRKYSLPPGHSGRDARGRHGGLASSGRAGDDRAKERNKRATTYVWLSDWLAVTSPPPLAGLPCRPSPASYPQRHGHSGLLGSGTLGTKDTLCTEWRSKQAFATRSISRCHLIRKGMNRENRNIRIKGDSRPPSSALSILLSSPTASRLLSLIQTKAPGSGYHCLFSLPIVLTIRSLGIDFTYNFEPGFDCDLQQVYCSSRLCDSSTFIPSTVPTQCSINRQQPPGLHK